jgi:hypothetical protein
MRFSLLLLALVATVGGAQPAAPNPDSLAAFAGTFQRDPGASDDVPAAIDRAVAGMNFITRPIGRRRLLATNQPPTTVRFALPPDSVVIDFAGQPPLRAKRDGSPRPWRNAAGEEFTARVRAHESEGSQRITQLFESEDGSRENTWRLDATGQVLTLEVVIRSPRLPQPLRYRQVLRRGAP